MKIGFIGLGRMGREMVLHLMESGVEVVVWNRSPQKVDQLFEEVQSSKFKVQSKRIGELFKASDVKSLIVQLNSPRVIWLMVEHGKAVDQVINSLIVNGITKDDIVIDGGNSFYKDSIRRYQKLKKLGIKFLDVGSSGGLEGARNGACLMVGGDRQVYERVRPILEKMAVKNGVAYFGARGAGHFVKMIHNGIEYGMLQALGEGFEILARGPYKLDLEEVASNWKNGSVVRGWLVGLLERAFSRDPRLEAIEGVIGGGSTGEWTVQSAKELGVNVPVIEKSLEARKLSRKNQTFSGKVVAALRREFGGHPV